MSLTTGSPPAPIDVYTKLLEHYTSDPVHIRSFSGELIKAYTAAGRHYHTLQHLQQMLNVLEPVKAQFSDYDTLLFALFYHDIVYRVSRKDNEEKSAALARERLSALAYSPAGIERCRQMILATKGHTASADPDIDLFTDADLSILGSSSAQYRTYAAKVRREYGIYPNMVYNPGRKKVLQHFLEMPFIFKTLYFRAAYESSARQNIQQELDTLS
jgi:predicted metal-dependent HD superfamily phosphohydrolase